jgi:hypothetical protein
VVFRLGKAINLTVNLLFLIPTDEVISAISTQQLTKQTSLQSRFYRKQLLPPNSSRSLESVPSGPHAYAHI